MEQEKEKETLEDLIAITVKIPRGLDFAAEREAVHRRIKKSDLVALALRNIPQIPGHLRKIEREFKDGRA